MDTTSKDNGNDLFKAFLTIMAGIMAYGFITTGGPIAKVIGSVGFLAAFYIIWFQFKNE